MLRGTVRSIDTKQGTVLIKHSSAGTTMPGMTMEFRARNREDLKGFKSGDEIEAEVQKDSDIIWCT